MLQLQAPLAAFYSASLASLSLQRSLLFFFCSFSPRFPFVASGKSRAQPHGCGTDLGSATGAAAPVPTPRYEDSAWDTFWGAAALVPSAAPPPPLSWVPASTQGPAPRPQAGGGTAPASALTRGLPVEVNHLHLNGAGLCVNPALLQTRSSLLARRALAESCYTKCFATKTPNHMKGVEFHISL